jgi:hypothetical protein
MTDRLVDVGGYREQLVQRLESLAAFRAREAADHPEDERQAQAAKVLRATAHEVLALPDDEPRLHGLATVCQAHDDDEVIAYVEAEDRILAGHGFGADATMSTDELLATLAKAADDAVKRA